MTEHPINFSAPMVNAILSGQKTQERRVIVPQGKSSNFIVEPENDLGAWPHAAEDEPPSENDWAHWPYRAPFGGCGSRLWVRESWQAWTEYNTTSAADLPSEVRANINYVANGNTWDARVRPPVSMPRWASRITLEVKDVRVERLLDISEEDALAEGVFKVTERLVAGPVVERVTGGDSIYCMYGMARTEFFWFWDSHAKQRYDCKANPWVWVIEFEVVK